jgi:two-component system sensor histidine kinase MprB
VAATQDLSRRLHLGRDDDEIGRLAHAFDRMLAQIEQARNAQEQLVADASHELRTPLTSLRTNIEVLAQPDLLDPDDRRQLIGDVVVQLDEFAAMVGGLVELARGDTPVGSTGTVQLDELTARIVDRLDPARDRIRLSLSSSEVVGDPERLERAVSNLIENALKYGGDAPVEVTTAAGNVSVRDHGPGIDPQDLPHVFERFYRSPDARGAPGSGLGLAIVRQVADAHDGDVEVVNAPDGGVLATLRLPERRAEVVAGAGRA